MTLLPPKEILIRVYSGAILVIWILAPYLLLQQFAIREVTWLEPTAFDRAIPVNFHSLWFYLTFYLLLGVVGLFVSRPVYLRYLYTIGWTTMVAHMVFLVFPNGLSRIEIPMEQAPVVYKWLVDCDAPRNAFPSLHAALSVVAGIAAFACKDFKLWARLFVWVWVIGILWSTIALRQHVLVDLISGAVVAAVCWWLVGRYSKAELAQ